MKIIKKKKLLAWSCESRAASSAGPWANTALVCNCNKPNFQLVNEGNLVI